MKKPKVRPAGGVMRLPPDGHFGEGPDKPQYLDGAAWGRVDGRSRLRPSCGAWNDVKRLRRGFLVDQRAPRGGHVSLGFLLLSNRRAGNLAVQRIVPKLLGIQWLRQPTVWSLRGRLCSIIIQTRFNSRQFPGDVDT